MNTLRTAAVVAAFMWSLSAAAQRLTITPVSGGVSGTGCAAVSCTGPTICVRPDSATAPLTVRVVYTNDSGSTRTITQSFGATLSVRYSSVTASAPPGVTCTLVGTGALASCSPFTLGAGQSAAFTLNAFPIGGGLGSGTYGQGSGLTVRTQEAVGEEITLTTRGCVSIDPAAVAVAIPTLSDWALLSMLLAFAGVGIVVLRR